MSAETPTERTDPVVVTGVGSFSAHGATLDALDEALRQGAAPLTEVDRSRGFHRAEGSRLALTCAGPPSAPWIPPMKARRMSPPSRFAVVAAKQALADAGMSRDDAQAGRDDSLGVAISTTFGPSSFTQRLLDQSFDEGPAAISPMLFTECVANAAPAQVSIHCAAGGPNYAISAREAGPIAAVARAYSAIRAGRIERMLAGTAEELTPLLHALLDRFGSLAGNKFRSPEAARPFGSGRDGFVFGEGATLWALESESAALARGARLQARILGVCGGFDPTASPVGWGHGSAGLGETVTDFLERIAVTPKGIDAIVSGASGSVAGDRLEAETLHRVWAGTTLPPVFAPKSVTGEYGGPFLAAALRILNGVTMGAAADEDGAAAPDPALKLQLADGFRNGPPRRILVSSLGSGGVAGWLVLERVES